MSMPEQRPAQLDAPVVAKLIKYMSRAQTAIYRATGGRVGGKWRVGAGFRKPVPTLLLRHRGRKTGNWHEAPLLYMVDGANLVVVASQGGLPNNPQWYGNLRAHPDVSVRVKNEVRQVRARTAVAAERAALWERLVELYADFASYQRWTEREIPVVVLEPR